VIDDFNRENLGIEYDFPLRAARLVWLLDQIEAIDEVQKFATKWLWTDNHKHPNRTLGGIPPPKKSRISPCDLKTPMTVKKMSLVQSGVQYLSISYTLDKIDPVAAVHRQSKRNAEALACLICTIDGKFVELIVFRKK